MTEAETKTRIIHIDGTPLSGSLAFALQREIHVENTRAKADGNEAFASDILVEGGSLERRSDDSVLYVPGEW